MDDKPTIVGVKEKLVSVLHDELNLLKTKYTELEDRYVAIEMIDVIISNLERLENKDLWVKVEQWRSI